MTRHKALRWLLTFRRLLWLFVWRFGVQKISIEKDTRLGSWPFPISSLDLFRFTLAAPAHRTSSGAEKSLMGSNEYFGFSSRCAIRARKSFQSQLFPRLFGLFQSSYRQERNAIKSWTSCHFWAGAGSKKLCRQIIKLISYGNGTLVKRCPNASTVAKSMLNCQIGSSLILTETFILIVQNELLLYVDLL